MYFSQRARGDWTKPVELPKHINTKLNLVKSYTLSPDGGTIYLTSIRGNGVGRYDIWYSERKATVWGDLKNMFLPINSKSNDGTPTFTPDGKTMYYMRCDQMSQEKASGCTILMSKMDNVGKWQEPVELPSNINTGNSQTPRIMADGETLIFSSDKLQPNKGGLDLYYSKFVNGTWQNPLPLEFANTEYDNQFVSVMANGPATMSDPGRLVGRNTTRVLSSRRPRRSARSNSRSPP
jgi:Tol biopolymer transport system component